MFCRLPFLALLLLAPGIVFPAWASSSDWVESEGGRVRLVTAGKPDGEGRLRGALVIELEPGWKTYWRDPGDAGVPPTLDVSGSTNVSEAEIFFPAPTRFDDGYSVWAGYDRSVSLPVLFSVPAPERPASIEAALFLGICETICIPVGASVKLDPAAAPDDPADRAIVEDAFATLPGAADAGFGISGVRLDGANLVVEASTPSSGAADLFVAGAADWMFGVPELLKNENGKAVFAVPVLAAPEPPNAAKGIHYTLLAGGEAVSGTFDLSP